MVKAVILFLLVMAVIALIGNAIAPGSVRRQVGKSLGLTRCTRCGRPMIGKTCSCGKGA